MLTITEPEKPGGFALFNLGFRPFFLGAGIFAVTAGFIWLLVYVFGWQFQPYGQGYRLGSVNWHAHEMIYGYSLAVISGFLLTAIKNWTGIQTLNGKPLVLLFSLWLAGRILPFTSDYLPLEVTALVDMLFCTLLIVSATYPLVQARLWRNMGIVLVLVLMLAGNTSFYLGGLGYIDGGIHLGIYLGLYLVMTLVLVMARRVMPMFIQNGVGYPVKLTNRKWLDVSALWLFVLFWIIELSGLSDELVTFLALILFVIHGIRLYGWHTHGIWKNPLIWILFLAYASLIAGFLLKAGVYLLGLSPFIAIHAFTVGGVGMITLGMMTRVSLGHTGRSVLEPPRFLYHAFVLLFLSTVARVFGPLINPANYVFWIGLSQIAWILSFSLFCYLYIPMLAKARADGKPG